MMADFLDNMRRVLYLFAAFGGLFAGSFAATLACLCMFASDFPLHWLLRAPVALLFLLVAAALFALLPFAIRGVFP